MIGKIITILVSLLVISVIIASTSIADDDNGFAEPPSSSGDGIPDGSIYHENYDENNCPNQGIGPAPNSGDGIPDGPGW